MKHVVMEYTKISSHLFILLIVDSPIAPLSGALFISVLFKFFNPPTLFNKLPSLRTVERPTFLKNGQHEDTVWRKRNLKSMIVKLIFQLVKPFSQSIS